MKKLNGHKLYTKSRFDRFFAHYLENSKYSPFPMYYPIGSRTSMVSRKNTMVINFTQSRGSISFSCTILVSKKTVHSQYISTWKVIRAWFHKKYDDHKLFTKSRFV
ncbi:hypothetical protein BHM03_00019278 [Ensete ventricosum]|nr:hypothetical protein BHM03_00019278 [Ensete ventricosum]